MRSEDRDECTTIDKALCIKNKSVVFTGLFVVSFLV